MFSKLFGRARFGERKIPWVPLIALVLSVAVFAVSLYYFQQFMEENARYVEVVVAKRTIPQYNLISEADLAMQKVRPDGNHPDILRDMTQAVGKMVLSTIYEGEQVHAKRLRSDSSDRQEVMITVDLTRSGGVSAGDMVDVYFLQDETTWAGARAPVAVDAVVTAVMDTQGNELSQKTMLQASGMLAAAKLSLKPGEVPWVVRGALPDSRDYVLVRKFRPGGVTFNEVSQSPPTEVGGMRGNP